MKPSSPLTRRTAHLLLLAGGLTLNSASSADAPAAKDRAVELTFLKAKPGERENLKRFIVLNGFAMDKVAKEQGLMSAFTVMDTGSDEGAWNVLVSVTYPNEKGYDGIASEFEKIRRAHSTVLVEGKALRDLGAVVETRRVFENPAHATR